MRGLSKLLLTPLLIILLASPLFAVGIDGPEKISVGGVPTKFTIAGATVQDLVKSEAKLIWYPRDTISVWEAATWGGEPYILVAASASGKYLLAITFVADGKAVHIEREIQAGEVPPPNPPDPPVPPTPPPGAKLQVVFLIDSSTLDNLPQSQRAILASLKLRQEIEAKGHRFIAVLDRHQSEAAPQELAPYFKATDGKQLPRIAVAPVAGGEIQDFALPLTEAELLKLLEGSK